METTKPPKTKDNDPKSLAVALLVVVTLYLVAFIFVVLYLHSKAYKKWPSNKRDGGFIILSTLGIILMSAIWPLSIPALWVTRAFVDSDWSCFGFNYNRWQSKRQARKEEHAQEIELDRMERAASGRARRLMDEHTQNTQQDEEARRFEEAMARVAQKRDAMLGRTPAASEYGQSQTQEGESSSNGITRSGGVYGCPREEEERNRDESSRMPDATVSSARGGRGINGSTNEGYAVVPRPIVTPMPPYLPQATNGASQAGSSSPSPPPYTAQTNQSGQV